MINIGIVGSRKYKNVDLVYSVVEKLCMLPLEICILSGGCPKSPDQYAKEAAKFNNDLYTKQIGFKEFLPKSKDKDGYFARNKLIAENSDFLIAFIPRNLLRSGAWNTVKWMKLKKGQNSCIVIDENGKRWSK